MIISEPTDKLVEDILIFAISDIEILRNTCRKGEICPL